MTITKDQFIEALNRQQDSRGRVYVLLLEHDCYYIGWTENIGHRLNNHFRGKGSAVTKTLNPIKVVDIYIGDKRKEHAVYDDYRERYGKNRVFGALQHSIPIWVLEELGLKH